MNDGWDKRMTIGIKNATGCSHVVAMGIVTTVADMRQKAYMEGSCKGYEEGYNDAVKKYKGK